MGITTVVKILLGAGTLLQSWFGTTPLEVYVYQDSNAYVYVVCETGDWDTRGAVTKEPGTHGFRLPPSIDGWVCAAMNTGDDQTMNFWIKEDTRDSEKR